MNRNLVKKGFGLLALAMALSLAALPALADGHATEVTLGTSGATVTVVRADDGSYSVGGSTNVRSILIGPDGSPLGAVAENGNTYLLSMDDEGMWSAAFNAPAAVAVPLGTSGETAMISIAEDGSYWVGDMEIIDGGTVTAANGNMYTLTMTDGMWSASYEAMTAEVMLGSSGDTATVSKAEDGSYSVDNMPLEDGGTVTAANGNVYTLTMADGAWSAAFTTPAPETVMLGTSGGSVTLQRAEDGSYSVAAFGGVSGYSVDADGNQVVTATNGNMYTLMQDADGMWMAQFNAPAPTMVALGMSGESVSVTMAEDGSYWVGDMAVSDGSTVMSSGGDSYTLSMTDGMWMATFQGPSVTVALGEHGGTVSIATAEDGSYTIDGMAFSSGGTVAGAMGNEYTLTMAEDGTWSAEYVMPAPVSVALGTSGSVMLQRAEDGSWTAAGEPVADGSTVTADNGNQYALALADGVWSAAYQGATMAIEGTGLTAVALEDGSGYDVSGATLPADGMGDITVGDASYRVWMADGELTGARYQAKAIDGATDYFSGEVTAVALQADDESTSQNEAHTSLYVNGDTDTMHSMGALLGAGMSTVQGENFVATAKEAIEKIRVKVVALMEVFEGSDLDDNIAVQWNDDSDGVDVEDVLETAFGVEDLVPDEVSSDDVLAEIDAILAALSSAEGLAAAVEDGGVLEDLDLGDNSAEDVFDATASESTVAFGVTGTSSYGGVSKQTRSNALDALDYTDDSDAAVRDGIVGGFGYSTSADTRRERFINVSGNATYQGGTVAMSGDGKSYSGDITIWVRFEADDVDGLITNLETEDGEQWVHGINAVDSIGLSATLNLGGNGTWTAAAGDTANISYALQPGSAPSRSDVEHTFTGRFVGGDGGNAGSEVVGAWSLGTGPTDAEGYLAGGFGAVRGTDQTDARPDIDDGTVAESLWVATEAGSNEVNMTAVKDGNLEITVQKYAWTYDEATDFMTAPVYEAVEADDDNAHHRTYTIPLTTLLAKQGAEGNTNGDKRVDLARTALEGVQAKLVALVDTDQLTPEQRKLRVEVAQIVGSQLFSWADIADSDLRDDDAVTETGYDGDEAVELVGDVLAALSSLAALEDALDPDSGGVFNKSDGTPFDAADPDASDYWNERDSQVKWWFGETDYTRFGLWRVRRSQNADRDGGWTNAEQNAFAYSPLARTEVSATSSPYYTPGASATYVGSALGWQGTDPYGADVKLIVEWKPAGEAVGGTLAAEFTNLMNLNAAKFGDLWENGGNDIVSLVYTEVNVTLGKDGTADANNLIFEGGKLNGVHFDRTTAGLTGNLAGVFVGGAQGSPLAVIGSWTAEGITGAFGAELP